MKRTIFVLFLFALFASVALSPAAPPHPSLPAIGALDGLGVNIHFTDPKPGELEMIKAAGFKWVRMDLAWGATERKIGEYDFSAYDRLVAALEKNGLHAVFILDYGNRLYDSGLAPHTDEGRAAFAKWTAIAVKRYAGKGYLWEMWNEPNIAQFWKPKPDVQQYIALTKRVAAELRTAGLIEGPQTKLEKSEAFIGPATSTIDLAFLEACFKAGLLEDWAAVSMHPYRQKPPESVEEEYRSVRLLVHRYAPKGKAIPLLSGEWGYSTAWPSLGKDEPAREETQAKYLVRMFLTNIANDIPLSIWYDWRDDGDDPKEGEHRFGIVRRPYREGEKEVFEPKPACRAMQTLTRQLAGMRYARSINNEETHRFLFTNGKDVRMALWNYPINNRTADTKFSGPIPVRQTSLTGEESSKELKDPVRAESDVPSYLAPETSGSADLWRFASTIPRLPLELVVETPARMKLAVSAHNDLDRNVSGMIMLRRSWHYDDGIAARENSGRRIIASIQLEPHSQLQQEIPVTIPRRENNYTLTEWISLETKQPNAHLTSVSSLPIIVTNALQIDWTAMDQRHVLVHLKNPSGREFRGDARFVDVNRSTGAKSEVTAPLPVAFENGQTDVQLSFPLTASTDLWPHHAFEWRDAEGTTAGLTSAPALSIFPKWLEKFGSPALDGDPKVNAAAEPISVPADLDRPPIEGALIGYRYRFDAGWRFLRLPLQTGIPEPASNPNGELYFALWIRADGKGCQARIRFKDATGQTFQSDGPRLDFTGWRLVKFPMHSSAERPLAHWGGANDAVIHFPISWDSILLLDNVSREAVEGEVYISGPMLMY